jgi:HEPN domain-containing protein
MTNEEKVKYWIDLSDRDLDTAEYLNMGGHNLYTGFMCHQAVEKILKGYFTKIKEDTPPFTHDVTGLAQKTGLYDLMSEQQKDFIEDLNPLNIEARYPEYKNKLSQTMTKETTQNILTNTKEFLQWTKQKI